MHISSIYVKILGKTNFHAWEFPQSGSKGKNGDRERERDRKLVITMASYALQRHLGLRTQSRLGQKKERRAKVGNNNGQLYIATPPWVAHAKPPGPISKSKSSVPGQNVRASKINKPFTEAFRLVIYSF